MRLRFSCLARVTALAAAVLSLPSLTPAFAIPGRLIDFAAVVRLYNVGGTAPYESIPYSCLPFHGQAWFGDPEAVYVDYSKKLIWTCAEQEQVIYHAFCPGDRLGVHGCNGN